MVLGSRVWILNQNWCACFSFLCAWDQITPLTQFLFKVWKYKSEIMSISKISFLSIQRGHVPFNKTTVIKKTIFRSISGKFQLLAVNWGVEWTFDWHIFIELLLGFRLICHMTPNIFSLNILGGYPPAQFWFKIWK